MGCVRRKCQINHSTSCPTVQAKVEAVGSKESYTDNVTKPTGRNSDIRTQPRHMEVAGYLLSCAASIRPNAFYGTGDDNGDENEVYSILTGQYKKLTMFQQKAYLR